VQQAASNPTAAGTPARCIAAMLGAMVCATSVGCMTVHHPPEAGPDAAELEILSNRPEAARDGASLAPLLPSQTGVRYMLASGAGCTERARAARLGYFTDEPSGASQVVRVRGGATLYLGAISTRRVAGQGEPRVCESHVAVDALRGARYRVEHQVSADGCTLAVSERRAGTTQPVRTRALTACPGN
jgi:hypothetical protein